MHFDRKPSSVIVTVIDHEKLLADILKEGHADGDEHLKGVISLSVYGQKICYVKTPVGTFVLDYECCGNWGDEKPITDEHAVGLKLYLQRDENSFPMWPEAEYKLTPEGIDELPTKGTMRLDQWARNYNDRCECNYSNWNRHLTKLLADESAEAS